MKILSWDRGFPLGFWGWGTVTVDMETGTWGDSCVTPSCTQSATSAAQGLATLPNLASRTCWPSPKGMEVSSSAGNLPKRLSNRCRGSLVDAGEILKHELLRTSLVRRGSRKGRR